MANTTHRYPNDVTSLGSYMIMTLQTFTGYSTAKLRSPDSFGHNVNTAEAFALPMPNAFVDDTGVTWSGQDDQSLVAGAVEKLKTKMGAMGKEAQLQASGISERHTFMQFGGVSPKSYTFFWEFIPQNKQESADVETLIDTLIAASLPSLGSGALALHAPDLVNVKFRGPNKFNRMGFLPCIISNIKVDYSPDGSFFTYKDGGVPVLTLMISLTEITGRNRQVQKRVTRRAK